MMIPEATATTVWASRYGDTPASMAGLFRQAAKLIESCGYNPCADSITVDHRSPAHSVRTALHAAAALDCPGDPAGAMDLCEEAHARLAGVLHLTGQRTRRTSISDICDEVDAWEACRPGEGWRTGAEAVAVLDTAAAMLDGLR